MIARFIRTVRILFSYGGVWCDGVDWQPEDALRLNALLNSDTGTRLTAKLRNTSISLNTSAVLKGEPHRCGYAAGYMTCLAELQALSVPGAPKDAQTSEDSDLTGGGELEHLSP